MSPVLGATLTLVVAVACGGGGSSSPYPESPRPHGSILPAGVYEIPAEPTTPSATGGAPGDAPEISRSMGPAGGVVVLWPRIVVPRTSAGPDAETRAIAARVQGRLAELARRALPGRAVEVRPEPERVCPQSGCAAVAVGVLFARAGNGCALVALVSAPGQSPAQLVPWAGVIQQSALSAPFREAPEKFVAASDYARCATVLSNPPGNDADVVAAIQSAAR